MSVGDDGSGIDFFLAHEAKIANLIIVIEVVGIGKAVFLILVDPIEQFQDFLANEVIRAVSEHNNLILLAVRLSNNIQIFHISYSLISMDDEILICPFLPLLLAHAIDLLLVMLME